MQAQSTRSCRQSAIHAVIAARSAVGRVWRTIYLAGCIIGFVLIGTRAIASNNRVVARVNGEEIREAELLDGLPRRWFGLGGVDSRLKAVKYERLIAAEVMAQYLVREGIEVDAKSIDAEIERLRVNPPSSGCGCCSYTSLRQYMREEGFTMEELRRQAANELGIEKAIEISWERKPLSERTPDAFERERIMMFYLKASHIFFSTMDKPEHERSHGDAERMAHRQAQQAMRRLQRGEAFEQVAADMSDDVYSRRQGGNLGMVSRSIMGTTFADAVDALEVWEVSEPVRTAWGIHIIRRENITHTDIMDVLRGEYAQRRRTEIQQAAVENTQIERLWQDR